MSGIDKETNQPRGYFILRKSSLPNPICNISLTSETQWASFTRFLTNQVPRVFTEKIPTSAREVVHAILSQLPTLPSLISLSSSQATIIVSQIQNTPLYSIVQNVLSDDLNNSSKKLTPEMSTLLLIACPSVMFKVLPLNLRKQFTELREIDHLPDALAAEVTRLRYEMLNLTRQCGAENCGVCYIHPNHSTVDVAK